MRKARSEFGQYAQSFFDCLSRVNGRNGFPGINTLAVMFAKSDDRKQIEPISQSKHKILNDGMPLRFKAMNAAYHGLESTEMRAALMLRWGYYPINGKEANQEQRAKVAGMTVGEFNSLVNKATREWKKGIKLVTVRMAQERASFTPPN